MSARSAPDEFTQLWAEAHAKFKEITGVDLLMDDLAKTMSGCKDADEVLATLDGEMTKFQAFRAGDPQWSRLRNDYIKPLINAVLIMNDAAAEATSAVVSFPLMACRTVLPSILAGRPRREINFGWFRCSFAGT
jgi:hypothetical protein